MKKLFIDNTLRVIFDSPEGARIIDQNIKKAELETQKRNKQHQTNNITIGTTFTKPNGITYQVVSYDTYFGQYECYNAEGKQTTYFTYEQLQKYILCINEIMG